MDKPTPININGYDTYFVENEDEIGNHLLIAIPPHANYNFSDNICGKFLAGHFITQIGYHKTDGKVTHMKAYY